jgi:hypothetical protein
VVMLVVVGGEWSQSWWVAVMVVRGEGADGVGGGGVHASMVCVVHGLSRSGEGGQKGCHWGNRAVVIVPGAVRQVGGWGVMAITVGA